VTGGSFDTSIGGSDAFVSKLDLAVPAQPTLTGTFPNSPANDNSPEVQGVADAGTTVKIYTNSSCSGTEVASGTAAAFASPGGLTVSVADNSTTTFYATATNISGSSPCSSSSITYVEDSTPPTAPSFDINGTDPDPPANDNAPEVHGSAAFPSTVKLYTASGCAPEAEVTSGSDATFANPGLTVSVPDDSVTTFWATATDPAGNTSACSSGPLGSITYTEDSTAPAQPSLTDTDPDSPADDNSPEVKGSAESGSTVKLHANASCSGTEAASGTAAAFASPGFTVSVANDSTTTFHATATDAAGNTSSCSAGSITYVEDSTTPAAPTLTDTDPDSPANDNSPEVKGTAESGSTVKLYPNATCSGTEAASGTAAAFASPGLTVSVANDSSTTFYATATDAAGHTSACSTSSITYVEDSTSPAAPILTDTNPDSPANDNSPEVLGTADAGSTVKLYANASCSGAEVASGSASTFGTPGLTVPVADDSNTTFYGTASDAAGNTSSCSVFFVNYVEDSAEPQTTIDSGPGVTSDTTPTFTFSANEPATFECRLDLEEFASCTSPHTTTPLADGPHTFFVMATDTAGNGDSTPASHNFVVDTQVAAPILTDTDPDSPGNDNSPEVKGTAEVGSTVKLYTTSNCTGSEAASGSAAAFASPGFTVSVADDSSTTFYATATDLAGNLSTCSAGLTYVEDSTTPAAPTLTDTDPDSPASNATPKVKGSAEAGSTVKLYTNATCTSAEAASGTAAAFASPGLTVTVPRDSITTFYAKATDAAANTSACSTSSITYVERSLYPRPGSATPLRVPLILAYQQCTSPNATHAQPLNDPSCTPAALESTLLRTGAGGLGSAFAKLRVQVGNPMTIPDEADIAIDVFASDVRKADNTDYTGQLVLATDLRMTDMANGTSGADSATVPDTRFEFPLSCVDNGGAGGGTCSITTTADTLLAGLVKEGKRAILSALAIRLLDAGANPSITPPSGTCPPTCGSGDEKVFMREGIFTP
jgi:hypothetical protein